LCLLMTDTFIDTETFVQIYSLFKLLVWNKPRKMGTFLIKGDIYYCVC